VAVLKQQAETLELTLRPSLPCSVADILPAFETPLTVQESMVTSLSAKFFFLVPWKANPFAAKEYTQSQN
jgi:hypothetical protein